jgi:hypothetical protein
MFKIEAIKLKGSVREVRADHNVEHTERHDSLSLSLSLKPLNCSLINQNQNHILFKHFFISFMLNKIKFLFCDLQQNKRTHKSAYHSYSEFTFNFTSIEFD